jgi:hypothetical protein
VDVTTHRRARAYLAGALAALAIGTLSSVAATPAFADDTQPTVNITGVSTTRMNKGGTSTINYTVTAPVSPGVGRTTITITSGALSNYITLSHDGGNDCGGSSCSFSRTIGASDTFSVVVTASNATTTAVTGAITIKATIASSNGTANPDTQSLTINAIAAPPSPTAQAATSVTSVSGTVKDIATGAAIPQAEVQLSDEAKHTWATGSNSKGQFSFKSTAGKPIVPGILVIGATKDGYQIFTRSFTGTAGQAMTVPALVLSTVASAAPGASTPPAATGDAAGANQGASLPANPAAGNGGGGGGFSTLLIVLGAVLVLLGVGAIVLILLRRKDGGDAVPEDGDDDQGPVRGAPAAVPASRGAFRSGPADATMVANADAPTAMLQRTPPVDEYPDPYGAPLPPGSPQPGYAGGYGQGYQPSYDDAPTYADQAYQSQGAGYGEGYPGGGYGDAGYDGGGYGNTQQAPGQAPGYGKPPPRPPAPADPYGAPNREYAERGYAGQYRDEGGRTDEATGMFDNYDQVYDPPRGAEGGYGGGAPAGYQSPPPPGPAYGGARDYGGGNGGNHGYGGGQDYPAPPRGYEPPGGGYEPQPPGGGYDPRAGYPQASGYDETREGYETEYRPTRSRHAAPPAAQPNHPAQGTGNDQRRSLDWLDD